MNASGQPAMRPPGNETEERLLEAALTLFAQKGYEAASVREIIEATGVTRPVLYYYCASKEDLFRRVVRWKHDGAYQELQRIADSPGSAIRRLQEIIRGSFAFCAADPRVPQLMFQTQFGPSIPGICDFMAEIASLRFSLVRQVVQDGLAAGELRGRDADSVTLAFCCLMDQHINVLTRTAKPRRRLSRQLADELLELFLFGVAKGPRTGCSS